MTDRVGALAFRAATSEPVSPETRLPCGPASSSPTRDLTPPPGSRPRVRRLSATEKAERTVTGGDLQRQVTDLATLLGWSWLHIRPGLRANGRWYVPVEGPLGKGWPDLLLLRERDRRLVFAELKREIGDPLTPEQETVLGLLRCLRTTPLDGPQIEVHVWRPSSLRDPIEESEVYRCLR